MTAKVLRTVPEGLEYAAERRGAGFTFVGEDGTDDEWSFERLHERARAIGHALAERGMKKGDRVALVLPTPGEFIPTFLGVTMGGGVPVPMYPPMAMGQLGGYLEHSQHIVGAAGAAFLVTNAQIKAVLGKLHDLVPELRAMLLVTDLEGDAALFRDAGVRLDDVCFLQFTSGSTSRPKGVTVTHENLAHNCHAVMRDGLRSHDGDRGVSWLPLFHDMGLIGFVLAPIQYRVPITFMMPTAFLRRPALWLQKMSAHRGTITYAPNFAYAITQKRVRDSELEGVDLSSVRVAGCGAEPINADTLRSFVKRFAPYGFREDAFVPSYGMAEYTLAIAFSTGIPTDRVRSETLWTEGRAEPVAPDAGNDDVLEIVGCGRAFPDHGIRIVDVETRAVLAERRVGEIEIRGPSVMAGYWREPEKTAETIGPDGWMKTGDLGYLADERVFICGRAKDVIIVNGKNYYPQDLEWIAGGVDGIRAGNAIAFAASKPGLDREAVVIVAETREPEEKRAALGNAIRQEVQRVLGLMPDEVVVADVGTILKTSSGKLQRSKTRAAYETGTLRAREDEGKVQIAGRLVQSQLAHWKLAIFGGKKG
jgi:fatty-acyl-CoA synthase